jgi:natural product precursor
MRKLRKIKLNQFSKDELDQRKMNALKGGCSCSTCSCCYSIMISAMDQVMGSVNEPAIGANYY